jgi:hypothetical protein
VIRESKVTCFLADKKQKKEKSVELFFGPWQEMPQRHCKWWGKCRAQQLSACHEHIISGILACSSTFLLSLQRILNNYHI